jgi:salicylate hydroxylase
MRILVVGGGIGGLTSALALRQAGFDAQAAVLREVGAGLAVGPNAVRELHAGRNLQLSDSTEVAARHAGWLENPDAQLAGFDWVWGYDAQSAVADS